jgi:4,5:9,10-diseco-3-hydroxy-5,9,17-trioxoandrosta-1(10),2-diene-4-oate hydrolase
MKGALVDVGGGLRVHAIDAGSGPPVVFLHGSGPGASAWSNFRGNLPAFVERGLRVVAVDTLGFGRSSKPDDVDYTLDFLAGALARALDALGVGRCAVVGNSHGGALAIRLALDAPERVERLVLMAPGGLEERDVYLQMPGIRAMVKLVLGKEPVTREGLRRVLEMQLHDPALLDDVLVDERLAVALEQPRRVLASLAVPHLAPALERLRCPVFGLWGVNDQFCPVSGARALERIPGARVLTINGCGHWVMIEKAALFNRLAVDFVKEGA